MVVGAPNIQEFAPSPDSILHIKQMTDIEPVAKRMKYLADNPDAYNKMLRCGKCRLLKNMFRHVEKLQSFVFFPF